MITIKLAQLFAVTALFSGLAGAQEINFSKLPSIAEMNARAGGVEVPVPSAAAPRARAQKEWTIMLFMNGKNNLAQYVNIDMNEMEQVGSTDKINIVAEAGKTKPPPAPSYPDYPGGWDDYQGGNPWGGGIGHPGWHPQPYLANKQAASADWYGVRRYYVTKDTDTYALGSRLVEELPKADMGDWNHLVEYVQWAKAKFPAKKYMLIVWNHGDGWKTKGGKTPSIAKGISYDDETGNGITTVQLGQALAKAGGVDVYASDACLMQMAEVVYELKDSAPVIVGSEETEPGDGWDYAAFLSRLTAANLAPEAVAKAAVEGYAASYSAKGKAVTLSAVRSREAEPLRLLTDQWVSLALTQDKAKLMEALNGSTAFEAVGSRDLLHFLAIAGAKLPALQAKGAEIAALVTDRMLIKNSPVGDKFKDAGGLAVYLPAYGYDENYGKLALSRNGQWDEFMKWLLAK
ncbi:MAG: clostripain-related cysteine peptidase [Elusimicrobia bacterium]|nr:clostripain-related cysteine peptidase [Elusimicrobiota bacterium]